MHNILHIITAAILPGLALIFVAALLSYKLYVNIRSRYDAKVNCWFCNENSRVPYTQSNSWTCPHCEQYNGFTKDGDYNRDLLCQRDASKNVSSNYSQSSSYYPHNGLCDQCNEAQRLKVEKLAQFEPKHESKYEQELSIYKEQLEQQFRLCTSCERHVNQVLHEMKKMVLGSKFLNFIIKGAALLKQPHFNRLARVNQQKKLLRYQRLMMLITVVQLLCLMCGLPLARREQFNAYLGEQMAGPLFFLYSHLMTLIHVMLTTVGQALEEQPSTAKLMLYTRTLGKLLLYSLGLNQHASFSSCFSSLYPYAMLGLSFQHILSEGLKLTRFVVILIMWSGKLLLKDYVNEMTLMLLNTFLTLLLLVTANRANLLMHTTDNESAGDSFHRLCRDECISDEENISLLSQQLSCSNASVNSLNTLRQKSPSLLSLDTLHLSTNPQSLRQRQIVQPPLPSPSLDTWSRTAYSTVRPLRSPQQLLMPSRLPMNRNVNAWMAASQPLSTEHLLTPQPQQLSRTSSQSSGFESQTNYYAQPPAFSDYGWPRPAATTELSYLRPPASIQPGDLLRKWIETSSRASSQRPMAN